MTNHRDRDHVRVHLVEVVAVVDTVAAVEEVVGHTAAVAAVDTVAVDWIVAAVGQRIAVAVEEQLAGSVYFLDQIDFVVDTVLDHAVNEFNNLLSIFWLDFVNEYSTDSIRWSETNSFMTYSTNILLRWNAGCILC